MITDLKVIIYEEKNIISKMMELLKEQFDYIVEKDLENLNMLNPKLEDISRELASIEIKRRQLFGDDLIFQGLKQQTKVARYHSLAVKRETLAKVLKAIALSEDGEVMAVKHIDYPVYGLQFHPESILTDDGKKMIENFLGVKEND